MSPGENETIVKPAAVDPIHLSQALLAPLDSIFKAQLHAARSFLNLLLQLGYPDDSSDYMEGDIETVSFKRELQQGRDIDLLTLETLKTDIAGLAAVSAETIIDAINHICTMPDLFIKVDVSKIVLPRKIEALLKQARDTALQEPELRILNKTILSRLYPQSVRTVSKGYEKKFQFTSQQGNGNKQSHEVSIPTLALVPIAPLAVESAEFKLAFQVENTGEHKQMRSSETKSHEEQKRPWFLVDDPISIRGKISSSTVDDKTSSSSSSVIQIEVKVGRIPMPSGLDRLLTALGQVCTVDTGK